MWKSLKEIHKGWKLKKKEDIYGSIFRLHHLTAIILLAIVAILATKNYVGDPIHCLHGSNIQKDVLNNYCWIHSTYHTKSAYQKDNPRAYVGVGTASLRHRDGVIDRPDVKFFPYYQWVSPCLLFQAILFCTPGWLWKNLEAGKIKSLTKWSNEKEKLCKYLHENLKLHNWWAYKYFFCEFLALGNVIGQMFLMNRFFDGEFFNFGINVMQFMESDEEDRTDPMIFIFPRMTKCTFFKFGVSGEIERHDSMCVLPLNVANEKIYVFLWFWLLALGALTLGVVIYRVIIIASPRILVYFLRGQLPFKGKDISILVKESKMGDWFLFDLLKRNLDNITYRDMMDNLEKTLQNQYVGHNPTWTT